MIHRALVISSCLAIAGLGAVLLWPSQKFVSLSTPATLAAKVERTTFDGLQTQPEAAAPGRSLSLDAAVRHWPRFAEMLRVAQHPGYFIERNSNDYWIVSIGDKLPHHFHSWAMLRVWKSGLIEKVNVPTGTWVPEYRPE